MANLSNINNKFLVTTGGNVLIGQTAAVGSPILQVTGNVNIGSSLSIEKLEVGGTIRIRVPNTSSATLLLNNTDTQLSIENTGGNMIFTTAGAAERMRIASDGKIQVGSDKVIWAGGYGGGLVIRQNNATGDRLIKMVTVDSTGAIANNNVLVVKGANVGIGTDSPGAALDVQGPIGAGVFAKFGINDAANDDPSIQIIGRNTANTTAKTLQIGLDADADYAYFNYNGGSSAGYIYLKPSGNVGIGTDSPDAPLQIASTNKTIDGSLSGSNLSVYTTDTQAANVGASIGLGGMSTTPAGFEFYGTMAGRKENSTNLDSSGYLAFYTQRVAVGHVERMRIDSSGNVGIGTTTMNTTLNLYSASNTQIGFQDASTGTTSADGFRVGYNGTYGQLWLFENADFRIATNNAERMRITSGGNIKINSTGTGDGFAHEQTITVKKTLGNNGVAIPVVHVGHTHCIQVTVILYQSTSNGACATARFTTFYGSSSGGTTQVRGSGAVSGLTIAYLNTNPAGQDYVLTITPTFISGNPPIAYVTVRGQSDQTMAAY